MKSISFIKGVGAGIVVGAVIGASFVPDKKHSKKMLGKAIRAMGDVLDDITEAVGR